MHRAIRAAHAHPRELNEFGKGQIMRVSKRLWFVGVAGGAIVVATASPALAQDINETVNGPSSGVVAAGTGSQNVTVTITKTGDVDNPTGAAVTATAQQGNVTVTDNGLVTGAAAGILGQTAGPNVSVTVTHGVAGGTGNAVEALDQAPGAASVTVGDGQNANHPLAITTTGKVGAGAISTFGNATIRVGDNVSISAGAPGLSGPVDVLALGVLTPADTGGPSAIATVGRNATLTVQGNNGAAVSAQIGLSGQVGPNGTASASVSVGDGVDINVSGFNNAGVIGFVRDVSPFGLYTGAGDVTVTVGAGTINVNENGAAGSPSGFFTNLGVGAFSAGGNVSVSNAADVTVSGGLDSSVGIRAATSEAGSASVTDSGSVASTNGDAIDATAFSGPVSVKVTGGDLAAAGAGIDATSFSGGIDVSTARSVAITAGFSGIVANSGGGSVTVTSGGPIVSNFDDGIDAAGGAVFVHVEGDITAIGGVFASSGGGPIDISIDKSVSVAARTEGVRVNDVGGPITVTSSGSIVTAFGDGIDVAGGAGAVALQVGGDITAGGGGVFASTGGGAIDVSIDRSGAVVARGLGVSAAAQQGDVTITDNGLVAGATGGILAQTSGPNVSVTAMDDVAGGTGNGVEALDNASGAANVTVGDGQNARRPLTISAAGTIGAGAVSVFGDARTQVGDNVTVGVGAPGESGVAGVLALSVLKPSDTNGPSAVTTVGDNATITVNGNTSAAVVADVGRLAIIGPNGAASASIAVGDGVDINVSGFNVAGVFGSVEDTTVFHRYAGSGDVSLTVGTGTINVNENGAVGVVLAGASNEGEAAFSAGGKVSITNAADVTVIGGHDSATGLETQTTGAGSSTIVTRGDIAVGGTVGDGVFAGTQNGANLIQIEDGAITATDAAVAANTFGGPITVDVASEARLAGNTGVRLTSFAGGAMTLDNAGQIVGTGFAAIELSGSGGSAVIDNSGFIGTGFGSHAGMAILEAGTSGLALTNERGGLIDGVLFASNNLTFNNAGVWLTAGFSNVGINGGASTSVVNNAGLIQVGEDGAGGAPTAASILGLAGFNNGSASATGVVGMINSHVGDSLTVSGLFTGAPGHSLLGLDVQLGGPGSSADQLILQGGSAGQTLIWVNDVLHGPGALNPGGIVLVQGSSAAGDFALDPHQPGYDPITKGIDKGLFTYPLVYTSGNEVLVGEPGLTAHQMATWGAAAEDIWSSTDPGDQSEQHLAFSLANGGGDITSGPHFWAQALNGGPSRLNGGRTLMGRANFASDPAAQAGAPQGLAGLAQQTASFSAYGMTYGFDTGYAQAVSALITGVDLGRHVGDRDAWSWGVSTGYLESQQSFTAGSSLTQFQGALAAVHGAYVNTAGFHVAGDVKMTALQVNYATSWGGGGASTPNATIDTFGAEADAGWTRPLGGGWTLDPVASLSMQSSKLGSLAIQGVDLRFGDASSARLGLGARLNGGGQAFGLRWKSQSSLTMWDELRGANTLDLINAGAGSVLPDPIGGTFADAAESFSLASPDGRASAFVSGAVRWKSDYRAAQIAMGVKLAW